MVSAQSASSGLHHDKQFRLSGATTAKVDFLFMVNVISCEQETGLFPPISSHCPEICSPGWNPVPHFLHSKIQAEGAALIWHITIFQEERKDK